MQTTTVEIIKQKISTDQRWAERAIVALYNQQTQDEKQICATVEHNGAGFSAIDAEILSSFAQQLISRVNYHLTPKQLSLAYKRLPKYAKQLYALSQAKNQTIQ